MTHFILYFLPFLTIISLISPWLVSAPRSFRRAKPQVFRACLIELFPCLSCLFRFVRKGESLTSLVLRSSKTNQTKNRRENTQDKQCLFSFSIHNEIVYVDLKTREILYVFFKMHARNCVFFLICTHVTVFSLLIHTKHCIYSPSKNTRESLCLLLNSHNILYILLPNTHKNLLFSLLIRTRNSVFIFRKPARIHVYSPSEYT